MALGRPQAAAAVRPSGPVEDAGAVSNPDADGPVGFIGKTGLRSARMAKSAPYSLPQVAMAQAERAESVTRVKGSSTLR